MVRHNYRDRYQTATEAIQALQNLTNNRNAHTVIKQKKAKNHFSNSGNTTVLNHKRPANHSNNGINITVLNHKKSQNYFKLVKKILVFGGITSIAIATIKLGINREINNLASPRLRLNSQSIIGNLESKNICENLNVSCQKYLLKGKKGQQVSIEMNSDEFDPSLALYTPDGKQLELSEDVSPNNWNAKIVADLPVSGNYIVIAKTYTQGESGDYSLQAFTENK